jgi:hypothetical protein
LASTVDEHDDPPAALDHEQTPAVARRGGHVDRLAEHADPPQTDPVHSGRARDVRDTWRCRGTRRPRGSAPATIAVAASAISAPASGPRTDMATTVPPTRKCELEPTPGRADMPE